MRYYRVKTIVLTVRAAKELDDLPAEARHFITEALCVYAVSGRGDVKKLTGRDGYRMRIGRYRVLFAEDAVTSENPRGRGALRSARDWRCAQKSNQGASPPIRSEPGAPRAAFNALSSGPAKVGPLLCLR